MRTWATSCACGPRQFKGKCSQPARQAGSQAAPTEVQQATCNLQQATGHINANALHAVAFSCALLWGNFSFDSIFIFYYAPVAVAEHSLLQLQPPPLQQQSCPFPFPFLLTRFGFSLPPLLFLHLLLFHLLLLRLLFL